MCAQVHRKRPRMQQPIQRGSTFGRFKDGKQLKRGVVEICDQGVGEYAPQEKKTTIIALKKLNNQKGRGFILTISFFYFYVLFPYGWLSPGQYYLFTMGGIKEWKSPETGVPSRRNRSTSPFKCSERDSLFPLVEATRNECRASVVMAPNG